MNLTLLYPEITLFSGALIILMSDVFLGKKFKDFFYFSHLLSLIFCSIAIYFTVNNFTANELIFNNSFISNGFTSIAKAVMLMLLIFIILISLGFIFTIKRISAEFLALLMIASVGGMILVSANDFLVFYLGLELQALSLYLLAALNRHSKKSSEAGMKYFILGSVASGILLFGISMIYAFSGTTNFSSLMDLYRTAGAEANSIPLAVIFGYILIIIALFFKISAAPFHMWVMDVYEGSATIVASFFATAVKFISVLALIRLSSSLALGWTGIDKVFIFVGILSIAVGSFGAIFQKNLKRLLAYSSIGHVGFVLLSISSFSNAGFSAAIFYMMIYSLISLGSFAFLNLIKSQNHHNETDEENEKIFSVSALSGLAKQNPVMAFSFATLIFSSAGIPPLAGFFSKFYVLSALLSQASFIISTVAVLLSVVSAFYYLRIIKVMYFDVPKTEIIKLVDVGNVKFIVFVAAFMNIILIAFANSIINFIANFIVN